MMQDVRSVSLIGLGDMGSALARAFLDKGHALSVWNRTAAKAAPLLDAGAHLAPSVDAAAAGDVLVICLSNYEVSGTLLGQPGVAETLRGKTVVQLTTGTPQEARDAEAWAKQHEIFYLDGAIMSYPSGVGTPECTILYSGSAATYEANRLLLSSLGGNMMYLGEGVGAASTLDSSLLAFLYSAELGFLQGAALSEAEGFSLDNYREALSALIPIIVADFAKAGVMIAKRDYSGNEASIKVHANAIGSILRFCETVGVEAAGLEPMVELARRAIATGLGGDELPGLFEMLRKKMGPQKN
jgi:3-hydroxyisobutyrate dehydrogenase-like beta-hydroxyacid dehydrogenase